MRWRRWGAGIAAVGAIGAGGTVAVDEQINPYDVSADKYELTAESVIPNAGEVKADLSKNEPAVTLSKWNGEAAMTVRYDGIQARGERAFLTDRVEWKGNKEEMHAYPLEAKAGMEDGGFEIEIVLNEKPDTNVFSFPIEGTDDLDFFYQPELTAEEIADGAVRPENVVGSYAVYHKTKANHRLGDTNYATGKVFHIYRPKAIDADGAEVWAELSYQNGLLLVAVPADFLRKAAYPVIVDPTFGKTAIGASNFAATSDQINCTRGNNPGEGGELTDIQYYSKTDSGTQTVKGLIYASSTRALIATGAETVIDTTAAWHISTISGSVTAQDYLLCSFFNAAVGSNYRYYYDTLANKQALETVITYPTADDPLTPNVYSTSYFSIYATYTASGGAAAPSPIFDDY